MRKKNPQPAGTSTIDWKKSESVNVYLIVLTSSYINGIEFLIYEYYSSRYEAGYLLPDSAFALSLDVFP